MSPSLARGDARRGIAVGIGPAAGTVLVTQQKSTEVADKGPYMDTLLPPVRASDRLIPTCLLWPSRVGFQALPSSFGAFCAAGNDVVPEQTRSCSIASARSLRFASSFGCGHTLAIELAPPSSNGTKWSMT
jgi:hypothetical protein